MKYFCHQMSLIGILGTALAKPVYLLRCLSTTTAAFNSTKYPEGSPFRKKLDFGPFRLFNKRHLREHKKLLFRRNQAPNKYPNIPIHNYGSRCTGIRHHASQEHIPEMVPELVVPDLTDCKLKPYVSYRTREIYQEPLTSKDLFNAIYGHKILKDYKEGKIDDNGMSKEPSREEELTPDEAWVKARRTGSDIFTGGLPVSPYFKIKYDRK